MHYDKLMGLRQGQTLYDVSRTFGQVFVVFVTARPRIADLGYGRCIEVPCRSLELMWEGRAVAHEDTELPDDESMYYHPEARHVSWTFCRNQAFRWAREGFHAASVREFFDKVNTTRQEIATFEAKHGTVTPASA